MGELASASSPPRRLSSYQIAQIVVGVLFVVFVAWRLYEVLVINPIYGPDTWIKFLLSGLIIGSVYALIAIGYTLVYGILRMINFAHSEVFMSGTFAGYFIYEAGNAWIVDPVTNLNFTNAHPYITTVVAFIAGISTSLLVGYGLERIAYRPLRKSPRLVPLISAIGASIFLQNAFQLIFGPQRRTFTNPDLLDREGGWTLDIGGRGVLVTYTGIFTFVLAILIMILLFVVVQRTKLGRAMRAVSEDRQTAALMGIDVDHIISQTFIISGALAGAAAVMWGIHYGQFYFYIGFIPGIKAFTAAVLGGIGNIPGAMLGAMLLGLIESMGPAALGIDFQMKDVIAFSILILVLIFRPSGILGEELNEEKV